MAKLNLKEIAIKATTLSTLMNGKEKIETKDICNYFPKGIRVNAAEEIIMKDTKNEEGESRFYVYTFMEAPDKYAFSGFMLTKIFDEIMVACSGDMEEFNAQLADGDLCIKLTQKKTKDGKRDITAVEVI